jgi:O-antigen/teichoic acid export membrane protein
MQEKLKSLIPSKIRSKFTNRPMLQKIVKNIGWLTGERVFQLVVSLLVGVWVARYLGPSDYGLLGYAGAFVALFVPFIGLGVKNILVRELVDKPELKDKLMGTTFWITLITSIITVFFIILLAFLINPEDIVLLQIIIIFAVGNILISFNIIGSYFQSKVESGKLVKARSIALIINSIFRICFIIFNFSVIWFAIAILIDGIILGVSLISYYFKDKQSIFNWKFDFKLAKRLLSLSWPLVFSAVFAIIYLRIDQVMIGLMLSTEEVGFYSVAVRLSEIGFFVPSAIALSLFPALMETKKKSLDLYFKRLQKMFDYFTWLAILMIIPIFFLSNFVITFLYGIEYAPAGVVLSILIWTFLSQFVRYGVGNFLTTEELYKISLYTAILGAIINVIANIILIPIYGINGAAFATIISYFFVAYPSNLIYKKTRRLFWMQIKAFNLIRIIKENFR